MVSTIHRGLLERWAKAGVLVFDGADFGKSQLAAAIQALPQRLKKLWQESAQQLKDRLTAGPEGWRGLADVSALDQVAGLTGHLRVACLSAQHAAKLGLPPNDKSIGLSGGIELVRFDCARDASAFCSALELSERRIEYNEETNRVWSERFEGLARVCRQVGVIDRYAAKRAEYPDGSSSGLAQFLNWLRQSARDCLVNVYSDQEVSVPAEVLKRIVKKSAFGTPQSGIREVTIHLIPPKHFFANHDRSVRFDLTVVELGQGLEVLEGRFVKRSCTFSAKRVKDPLLASERYLASKTEKRVVVKGLGQA